MSRNSGSRESTKTTMKNRGVGYQKAKKIVQKAKDKSEQDRRYGA